MACWVRVSGEETEADRTRTRWAAAGRQAVLNASVESAVGHPVPSSTRLWFGRRRRPMWTSFQRWVSTRLSQSAAHSPRWGLTENNGLTFTANSQVTANEISESVTFLTLWITFLKSRGFWEASAKVKEGPEKVGPVQDPFLPTQWGSHSLCHHELKRPPRQLTPHGGHCLVSQSLHFKVTCPSSPVTYVHCNTCPLDLPFLTL